MWHSRTQIFYVVVDGGCVVSQLRSTTIPVQILVHTDFGYCFSLNIMLAMICFLFFKLKQSSVEFPHGVKALLKVWEE